MPLSFDPGEAYQFDWSYEYAILSGTASPVKAAHMRLCHSRMLLVQIFPREGQEMVFEAHDRAFRLFGGACRRGRRRRHPSIEGKTVWQVFEEEQPFLMAYRGPFDGFHAVEAAASKTCLVRFDNNHYSVAARAVGRPVDVRAYADRIVIRQDGETVAEHPRRQPDLGTHT